MDFFHRQIGLPTGSETSLKRDVNCIQNVSTRRLSLQWRQFADNHRLITTCRRIRRFAKENERSREMEIIIIKFTVVHKVQKERRKSNFEVCRKSAVTRLMIWADLKCRKSSILIDSNAIFSLSWQISLNIYNNRKLNFRIKRKGRERENRFGY